ncbi:ferredoxin family protein [Chloroflexota bacterium]
MPIEKIDEIKCNGCKICVNTCPLDVIRFDESKNIAYIAYPEECDFCRLCENSCPLDCIYVSPTRLQQLPLP